MFSVPQPKHDRRWPRGQRFGLSAQGVEVEAAYRATVQDVRSLGREALALAEKRWAEPLRLSPGDGVVMAQIRESVDRLVERGLVEALPLPGTAAIAP